MRSQGLQTTTVMDAVCNPYTKTAMVSIPIEIITEEILLKLPAKSLFCLKFVSKFFYALISSPDFINFQLRESLSSTAKRLLILAKKDSCDLYLFDIDSSGCDTAVINISLLCTLEMWLHDFVASIVGSFNGLACVGLRREIHGIDEYKHVMINPTTGVFREVPYKCTPALGTEYQICFGFGYDDISKDYKLVRVAENAILYPCYQVDVLYTRQVMVYSLNKDTWKLVENLERPTESMCRHPNGVLMKNHLLHWIFWDSDRYSIYCFDLRSDKWVDEVPLVDFHVEYDVTRFRVTNLGVLDECLCFTATSNLSNVVWMMKEYGVKESWIQLFEIPRCSYYFNGPYGFRQGSKQEVLVKRRSESGLYWFNIGSEANGETEEISGIPDFDEAYFLTESLVPIPSSKLILYP